MSGQIGQLLSTDELGFFRGISRDGPETTYNSSSQEVIDFG